MRARVVASDLVWTVETSRELYSLVPDKMRPPVTEGTEGLPAYKESLTSRLGEDGRELAAEATLSFVPQTLGREGIDVELKPAGEHSWHNLSAVNVKVAYSLYEQLATSGLIIAYYSGDKRVEIRFAR